ncbi:uncharacterized protein LOC9648099 [Selaginella moellendorffii]|uniref:uncharacterized protein LOC9648099 n=1 Tax=Selaginella moellendorffii TaxID=88036 RepID=UPI000D1CC12B|nr:uncharacterized protein LOC9648099 [Selaginella moellendorffii]|eukprot:XP_024541142.1 uncharacterized protein LOC9648099 [Selaginella moellendorffii]
MKVVVVFDAKESGLPSHRESRASVDIVFAADACADSWIKREVYLLRDDGCPKIRVITSDSLHQQVANGAGAYVWSCKDQGREERIGAAVTFRQVMLHYS